MALLRVGWWAGGGGELVAYYERNGFTPTTSAGQSPGLRRIPWADDREQEAVGVG